MIRERPAAERRLGTAAAALLVAVSLQQPIYAQVPPSALNTRPTDEAIIGGTTGQNSKGVLSINIASGSNNQQLRSLVIANGSNAFVGSSAEQSMRFQSPSDPNAFVEVNQGVFAGASGAMSLNVVAGDANQQANLGLFGIGISGVAASDALLSQTRASASQQHSTPKPSSSNTADVPSDAFGGAQGLVQINLTAGNRNSSANIFALTAAGGNF